MLRALAIGLMLTMSHVLMGAGVSHAQPVDQWHYIDETSVLHTDVVTGLHGAGVIQSDTLFAMLYLGLPEDNGVVSVVLPTVEPASELSSTLIATNGDRFERLLLAEELDTIEVNDGTYAYAFSITAIDVERFKSARIWQVQVGSDQWDVTLTGSRSAITEAERQYEKMIQRLEADTRASTKSKTTD